MKTNQSRSSRTLLLLSRLSLKSWTARYLLNPLLPYIELPRLRLKETRIRSAHRHLALCLPSDIEKKTSSSPPPKRSSTGLSKRQEEDVDLIPAIQDIRNTLIDCNNYIKVEWEVSIDEQIQRQLELLKVKEAEAKAADDP
eukprot:767686-Hanusia_phi.AAC.1